MGNRYVPRSAARAIYERSGLTCPACGFRARQLAGLLTHMYHKHPSLLYDLIASSTARHASRWWRRRATL